MFFSLRGPHTGAPTGAPRWREAEGVTRPRWSVQRGARGAGRGFGWAGLAGLLRSSAWISDGIWLGFRLDFGLIWFDLAWILVWLDLDFDLILI